MINKQTTLDLNGPILSFTINPVGVASTGVISGTGGGIATFVGVATATFASSELVANTPSNTGIITYKWYEVGVGELSDSTYVTGTATTTLTISNLITPVDNQRQFYLTADYIPSAYQSSTPVTAGTARSTGNAINEPFNSGIGTLTVYPLLRIVAQPTSSSAGLNNSTTFRVNANLTDNSFSNDLTYQWYWDGVPVNDGTVVNYETVTTTTVTTTLTTTTQIVTSTSNIVEDRIFYNDATLDLDSTARDITITIAGASGGKGGDDLIGGTGGYGGEGRRGTFSYINGAANLSLYVGKRGNDGGSNARAGTGGGSGGYGGTYRGGADGGNSGTDVTGASGGGGGGGGASVVLDSRKSNNGRSIMAAGGGGGGGGSWNIGGLSGDIGGGFGTGVDGRVDILINSKKGDTTSGDGGGGGGQGGGATPNTSRPNNGRAGRDRTNGTALDGISAEGGRMMFSAYDASYATLLPPGGSLHSGDGFINVKWTRTTTTTTQVPITVPVNTTTTTSQQIPRNTILSGTKTPILTVNSDRVGINTVTCLVSSVTAGRSTIFTDVVNFSSVSSADQVNIRIEEINNNDTASISNINLFNGEYQFVTPVNISSGVAPVLYSFYAPDRDIDVEMDLYGGGGVNVGRFIGGEGGFSRIRFTMTKDTEYIIVGLTPEIKTPYLYRKGKLIASVGGGGNAGVNGAGGNGGGVNVVGGNGFGPNSGTGGTLISSGSLSANGIISGTLLLGGLRALPGDVYVSDNRYGGRVLSCTKGNYWRTQGYSACDDVGTTQFRNYEGTIITNTSSITRGFKSGYSLHQSQGVGADGGGTGGSGVTGGNGGRGGGGGGGSGYTDGSVRVISTRQGGNTGDPRVVLRFIS